MTLGGILTPIENVLTDVLVWMHDSGGLTWAWAIVAMTVCIRVVILPLTIKQIRSMQRLQAYAPELKALQQKYKHDKQRLNEEVMKFYREHKVNPAASCLPILPQIPIFISLFYVLRDFEKEVFPDFPQSELGFLNDLVPDITAKVNEHWSGWLLLVIYVGSQVLSLLLSTTAVQSKTQRYLFIALPFIFIPFIINFPVGLMIYWVTTNLWTVGQGIVTRRLYPRPSLEPQKRTSRTPPREEVPAAAVAAAPKQKREPRQRQGGQAPAKTAGTKPAAAKPATADGASGGGGSASGQRHVRRRKKKGPRPRR
jgi:YidC/Oxa1 family membrane protein insertase